MPAIQTTGSFISCTKTLEQHSGEVPFLFVIHETKQLELKVSKRINTKEGI